MGSHLVGDDMACLLRTINEHTMLACSRNAVVSLDLAQPVPRNLDYFFESIHFNETVAQIREDAAPLRQANDETGATGAKKRWAARTDVKFSE
jgi:hypothetical protein